MYYCIDCCFGNGKGKPYPSDHVFIFAENIKELIKKFETANKSLCFECWEKCVLIPVTYPCGECNISEPIQIKFLPHFKIQIEGFGEFQLEKPGSIQNEA